VSAEDAEAAVTEVTEAGYLDDADFARCFVEDRRRLDGWGERRIAHDLARRGVPEELIEAALNDRGPETELDAATTVLEERAGGPLNDDGARRRALGVLVRRGYSPEVAYEAIRRHERGSAPMERG